MVLNLRLESGEEGPGYWAEGFFWVLLHRQRTDGTWFWGEVCVPAARVEVVE